MKFKYYKILTLLGVGFITSLTTGPVLNDVHGALTAPASYDLNYRWDSINDSSFAIGGSSMGDQYPIYTRTTDGIYYNYSTTIDNSDFNLIPLGLEITMTFNRSNTSWFFASGGYYPDENKIGSTNAVGTIANKVRIDILNNTTHDYLVYFDLSNSQNVANFQWLWNDSFTTEWYLQKSLYTHFVLSPGYKISIRPNSTSAATYFDAWYLKDLGVSDAYDTGFDAGYGSGQDDADLLVTGFQAMVGILVNLVLMIVNLEVFGISILSVFSILALFVGIIWILKIIRG
jgi:hypothetical protein